MSEPLYVGSVARIEADVYDNMEEPRVLADPTTFVLTVTSLTGVVNTYSLAGGTVIKISTGKYYALHTCASAGRHKRRWVSTGANAAALPGTFEVLEDPS